MNSVLETKINNLKEEQIDVTFDEKTPWGEETHDNYWNNGKEQSSAFTFCQTNARKILLLAVLVIIISLLAGMLVYQQKGTPYVIFVSYFDMMPTQLFYNY